MATDLPSPPFIDVPGLINARDIGGYPIGSQPGKVVRRGVLFRSGDPSETTDEGVARLKELGITLVYDLRSIKELERDKNHGKDTRIKEWEGARRIYAPVFRDTDYSPEAVGGRIEAYKNGTKGFVRVYVNILKGAMEAEARPYCQILEHLASDASPPAPILVHCTAGKDRTGVICALVLSLCGVKDEVVAHEYSLTNLGFRSKREETIQRLLKSHGEFGGDRAAVLRMVLSKKEYMFNTLKQIREEYGSVEACVLQLGLLTADGIERLRRNLIVDASTTEAVDWRDHAELVVKEEEEASKKPKPSSTE